MKARTQFNSFPIGLSQRPKMRFPTRLDMRRVVRPQPVPIKGLGGFAAIILLMVMCFAARAGQNVSLAWSPSTNAVSGYAIHYGNASHSYFFRLDVGTNTTASLSNLRPGGTNFFAVTAYDSTGMESSYSSELAYIVPGILHVVPPAKPGDVPTLKFPVAPGHWYEVQATTDMHTWSTISTTPMMTSNYWAGYQDPKAKAFHSRFYRLVLH